MVSAISPRRADAQRDTWVSLEVIPAFSSQANLYGSSRPKTIAITADNLSEYLASKRDIEQAEAFLVDRGAEVLVSSRVGRSLRIRRERLEAVLGSKLDQEPLTESGYWSARSRFVTSATGAKASFSVPHPPDVAIIPPHLFFASAIPPTVPFHHLRLADLPLLMGAASLHRKGITGQGIRIVLVDSGAWLDHPFFQLSGYNVKAEAAADCPEAPTSDRIGHGTAVLANLLVMAPDAEVIAIKTGANLVCAFRQAVACSPDIICLTAGYDLSSFWGDALGVPDFVRALEMEIADAASNDIVITAPVGNGHLAFPGMHPNVMSVGGVYIDRLTNPVVSDYCSVYEAPWYENRRCPDLCGLSGLHPAAAYIMSPVPVGSQIDRDAWDLTGPTDAWSVIGGSSLCAAHVAAGCALVLQRIGRLPMVDLRSLLIKSGCPVEEGEQNIVNRYDVASPAADSLSRVILLNLTDLHDV